MPRESPRRIRRFFSCLAARLPPRHVVDRLFPWATLAAALVGGFWALWTWNSAVQVRQIAATLEFFVLHRDRFDPDIGKYAKEIAAYSGAQNSAVLTARCQATTGAAKSGSLIAPDLAVFDCETLSDANLRAAFEAAAQQAGPWDGMRDAIRAELVSRVAALAESPDHQFVWAEIAFLNALASCVNAGNCDEATAAALFYEPIVQALNRTCVTSTRALQRHDPRHTLVIILLRNDAFGRMRAISLDAGQQMPFLCPETRKLAEEYVKSERHLFSIEF